MKKRIVAMLALALFLQGCVAGTPASVSSSVSLPKSVEQAPSKMENTAQMLLPKLTSADPASMETTPQNWWFGGQMDDENRPQQCVSAMGEWAKYGLTALGPQENAVYLTFDFGYETGYSAAILDVLEQKQATATFFIVQNFAQKETDTLTRMVRQGHSIGSHSITHPGAPNGVAGLSITQQMQEIGALADLLQNNYNYTCYLYRPPEGIYSQQTLGVAANLGYYSVFWSYAYNDWSRDAQPPVAESLQKALDAAHPGAIYLLHPQSTNTEMLPALIDGLRQKGYEVKGL